MKLDTTDKFFSKIIMREKSLFLCPYDDGIFIQDKHIRYFVIDPEWIRYAGFNEPVKLEEMNFSGCK